MTETNAPTYYNDSEPFVCAWMQNLMDAGLIAQGKIDNRPIQEIMPDEVRDYRQAHWFSGIGGWAYALQLAGVPNLECWTASLPCQPFSVAGKQQAERDDRHLWPVFFNLVRECRPVRIFGEQVQAAIRIGWIDRVFADLASEGYTCGFVVLGAHSVGAPHIRQRIFWVADLQNSRCAKLSEHNGGKKAGVGSLARRRHIGRCDSEGDSRIPNTPHRQIDDGRRSELEETPSQGRRGDSAAGTGSGLGDSQDNGQPRRQAARPGRPGSAHDERLGDAMQGRRDRIARRGTGAVTENGCEGMGDADRTGCGERCGAVAAQPQQQTVECRSAWSDGQYIRCADGKTRLIEPVFRCMVDGVPIILAPTCQKEAMNEAVSKLWVRLERDERLESQDLLLYKLLQLVKAETSKRCGRWSPSGASTVSNGTVLGVRGTKETAQAPQRRGRDKQPKSEYRDSLCGLSCAEAQKAAGSVEMLDLRNYVRGKVEAKNGLNMFGEMPAYLGAPISTEKVEGRVGMLRGFGNAIVPQVAAEFIKAFLET